MAAPEISKYTSFFETYRNCRSSYDPVRPVVVHCSAGIGRSGTFIAQEMLLDHVMHELKANNPALSLNVPQLICKLRSERPGMVQKKEQFQFIYEFLDMCIEERKFINDSATTPRLPDTTEIVSASLPENQKIELTLQVPSKGDQLLSAESENKPIVTESGALSAHEKKEEDSKAEAQAKPDVMLKEVLNSVESLDNSMNSEHKKNEPKRFDEVLNKSIDVDNKTELETSRQRIDPPEAQVDTASSALSPSNSDAISLNVSIPDNPSPQREPSPSLKELPASPESPSQLALLNRRTSTMSSPRKLAGKINMWEKAVATGNLSTTSKTGSVPLHEREEQERNNEAAAARPPDRSVHSLESSANLQHLLESGDQNSAVLQRLRECGSALAAPEESYEERLMNRPKIPQHRRAKRAETRDSIISKLNKAANDETLEIDSKGKYSALSTKEEVHANEEEDDEEDGNSSQAPPLLRSAQKIPVSCCASGSFLRLLCQSSTTSPKANKNPASKPEVASAVSP
eukprot:TRINITY_DN9694_c0_g2_i1.p1 TRINITY_DN9694_c0_g2~~TRINITY_DN9694_c0_g2_i1.p1  ORF type:complete len:606 (-),score=128.76 TRINITY_DN9694_c0_g2_i1:43-1590(-)